MMFGKVKATYEEFPDKFWVLVGASFIDRVGGTMIFPFFSLYVTQKFGVGMTEAGILLAIFSVFGFVGSLLGGALSDKFGRRGMVLFGLIFSALTSLGMGLVTELNLFYLLAVVTGTFSNIAGPARQAMVADLLPEAKRSEGYGVLRVVTNLAWIVGPTVGGIMAAYSFLVLFLLDAVSSVITAVIVYRSIPETQPERAEGETAESLVTALVGYGRVATDVVFMTFVGASILMLFAYQQVYSTLSVYLFDVHGVPAQGYGLLMSMNALCVVLLQFWVMRRLQGMAPMLLMAMGSLLYMVGLTMYGVFSAYWLFMVAMLIVTAGEMIVMPVGQTLVANLAPEAMRGRYMGFYSLSWTIPSAVGPWGAGVIMDQYNPDWVWYGAGIFSALAAVSFMVVYVVTRYEAEGEGEEGEVMVMVEAAGD